MAAFSRHPVQPGDVVFLGDSLTEDGNWQEWLPHCVISNRGVSGDKTLEILTRIDELENRPSTVFLMIGTNDIGAGIADQDIVDNVKEILSIIRQKSPDTTTFVQSILPRSRALTTPIREVNQGLQRLASQERVAFINLYPSFADDHGGMCDAYSGDELHLLAAGYEVWLNAVRPLCPVS